MYRQVKSEEIFDGKILNLKLEYFEKDNKILKYGKDFYMYFLFYLYDMLFFIRWNFICVQERIL